ncbi:hypothetical protein Fmac_013744 [Flemingia macrophylla]|uniref:C2 and GRAM domain-containing protein n=1 Tax=Flemingia macrophylla TaxID=520843 RepID=A0ABD1MU00_9FABA
MKLVVRVIEAKDLAITDSNGLSDLYVRIQLGKQKFKTKVVKSLTPIWDEQFTFWVDDLKDSLVVSVMDEDKFFNHDYVGQVKVPISHVFDEEIKSLGTVWYSMKTKNKKAPNKQCGILCCSTELSSNCLLLAFLLQLITECKWHCVRFEGRSASSEIHLSIYICQNNASMESNDISEQLLPPRCPDTISASPSRSFNSLSNSSSLREETASTSSREDKYGTQKSLAGRIAQIFNKGSDLASTSPSISIDSDHSETNKAEVGEIKIEEEQLSNETFEETMKKIQSADQGSEIPNNLSGGVLIDQLYIIAPEDLNVLLFSSDSNFPKSLSDVQGTTELQIGPWKFESGGETLKRSLTYTKAPTKLIKAVKGYEDQTYLKADGKNFAVLATVSTPDVMYGSAFRVEILYVITPGPELPSGEQCSRLVISWRMNFVQSTMMKGMIENGARQGMKESFDQYAILLCQTVKPVETKDLGSSKEQALATLQPEPQSDLKLAVQYFANITVLSTFLMVMYVLVHIWLAEPGKLQGLEFVGLDLPDSIGEFVVSAVLVLQGERVLGLISRFLQARARKERALLTELNPKVKNGVHVLLRHCALDFIKLNDILNVSWNHRLPGRIAITGYVCKYSNRECSDHGIKPQGDGWLLTVALIEGSNLSKVDYSGFCDPYVVFTCNGKTRTSSIKFKKSEPLWNEIFEFDATDDPPSVLDVEVFDFDGPFDEAASLGRAEINFLKTNISDLADIWVSLEGKLALACQSKLHLRIFLDNTRGENVVKDYISKMEKEVGKKINMRSPQTNSAFQKLFGLPPEEFLINDFTCHLKRKMPLQVWLVCHVVFKAMVKFYFGRGVDAKHGAKSQDEEGRLKFRFQSFVSFNVANRTIMALWKARSLSPEQKVQLVEEDSETKSLRREESGSFIGLGEVSMSEVHSCALSVPASFFMELFGGGELDRMFMEKSGCVNYSFTPWVSENSEVHERAIYYKFEKRISRYRVEVTSTQQRSSLDGKGWKLEEVMNFHGVPLGDYFNVSKQNLACS